MPGFKSHGRVTTGGAVARVETTRQAKRRHRMSGGAQWTPTTGQINAADIWNRQKEKLKRDKEREERKRKNAARQAEKDARFKEIQEEMVRKGRITIEDTWGKVSGSQNRLHKFFNTHKDAEQGSSATDFRQIGSEERVKGSQSQQSELNSNVGDENQQSRLKKPVKLDGPVVESARLTTHLDGARNSNSQTNKLYAVSCSSSPPSACRKRRREPTCPEPSSINPSENSLTISLACKAETDFSNSHIVAHSSANFSQSLPNSRSLMPPPPRLETQAGTMEHIQPRLDTFSSGVADHSNVMPTRQSLIPVREPLAEMTLSQLNVRANEKPDPEEAFRAISCAQKASTLLPLSAQELHDTIWGLSSQDFKDDFGEQNKENSSPIRFGNSKIPQTPKTSSNGSSDNVLCSSDKRSARPSESHVNLRQDVLGAVGGGDSSNFDDFDDLDVDNEILLSLAATQRLERDLQDLPPYNHILTNPENCLRNDDTRVSNEQHENATIALTVPQSSDSFIISGVDDQDLLQCVQEFEVAEDDLDDRALLSFVEKFEEREC